VVTEGGCQGKYERLGYRVTRNGSTKIIDSTQDWSSVIEYIEK